MTKTIIQNVAVFDGHQYNSGPVTVVIDGDKIHLPSSEFLRDGTEHVIDAEGCTILPGFLDCHVHANDEVSLAQFVPFGITTVLDMGTDKSVRELKSLTLSCPEKFPTYRGAGTAALSRDSHHAKMVKVAEEKLIDRPEQANGFVAACVDDGSDYIKVIADVPGFDEPVLDALAVAARQQGKTSVAHAAFKSAYERASRAGFDILTHIPADAVLGDETVEILKADKRVCVPTLGMMEHMVKLFNQRDPSANHSLEPALKNVERVYKSGIPICTGTDCNNLPGISLPFGSSYFHELELMVQSGMSNLDVLKSSTSEAAKHFGLHDRGEIKEGKRSDLILVQGNPLDNIGAVKDLKAIWVGGLQVPNETKGE
jgi:imidazolonepropionase-like amidohydrolase